MSAFEYSALDHKGRSQKGVLEGDHARQIRTQLRDRGLTPLSVVAVHQNTPQKTAKPSNLRLSATELALLTRQLATLISAGMAIDETLQAVAQQAERKSMISMLLAVRAKVTEGHSLAEGLTLFPKVFPKMFQATVTAGEQSGHLALILERLADYTENRQHLRQKTLLALFYPALLTLVAVVVMVGLLTFVVPQVVQVFVSMKQSLPWLTQALIDFSYFLRHWGGVLLLLLLLAVWMWRYAWRWLAFRCWVHRQFLHWPVISRLVRGANVARFTRTLSILLDSGVPLLEALSLSQEVVSNCLLRQAVVDASEEVRQGGSLSAALGKSGLFPPMMVHLIASGENSGQLAQMLNRAAVHQERELETVIAVVLGLFEPLLILFMGGLVLLIVLAILLPIFDLNQLVGA
jgi:general secretion pathway protein F